MQTMKSKHQIYYTTHSGPCCAVIFFSLLLLILQIKLLLASGQDASLSGPLNPIKFDDEADYINGQSDGLRIPARDESKTAPASAAARASFTSTSTSTMTSDVHSTDLPIDCSGQVKYFNQSKQKAKLPGWVNGSLINDKIGHRFAFSPSEVPFVVKITIVHEFTQFKCSGALIHPEWVVTSSACNLSDQNNKQTPALIFISTGIDFGDARVTSGSNHRFNKQGKLVVAHVKEDEKIFTRTVSKIVTVQDENGPVNDGVTGGEGSDKFVESSLCTPILLKLSTPFKRMEEADTVCVQKSLQVPFSPSVSASANSSPMRSINSEFGASGPNGERRAIALGWSTYGGGGSGNVQERLMRLTSVKITPRHCLSSDLSSIESSGPPSLLCVKYLPQAHFYLLPGSPLISIDTNYSVANLLGLACSNLSTSLINSQYVYMQTYFPMYKFAPIIQEYLEPYAAQSDEGANLFKSSASIVSCVNTGPLLPLLLPLLASMSTFILASLMPN